MPHVTLIHCGEWQVRPPRASLTAELQKEPVPPQHKFSRCLHQEFILTTLVGQIPHMINTAQKQI